MQTECTYMKNRNKDFNAISISEKCMLCALQMGSKTYALKDGICYSTVDTHLLYQYVLKEDLCGSAVKYDIYEIGRKEQLEFKIAKVQGKYHFCIN